MKKCIWLLIMMLMVPGVVNAASATLTWTANTETDLAGYKVYRGNGVCAVGPLAPLLDASGVAVSVAAPATTYMDKTVPVFDGELCYEITAYDTAGNESGRSNRATKTVNLVPPVSPTGLVITTVTP
jgi:hypothetical protein